MRTGLNKDLIAKVLGAAPKYTIAQLEEIYPKRKLPEGAEVTRFAPSPTGFVHIGNLCSALIDWKIARQTNGVFYLRFEDTDTKREVEGATELIVHTLDAFGINPDETYRQSERKDIYHSVVAELLEQGKAYPCFMTEEEISRVRDEQSKLGAQPGIYGDWARDRNILPEEIEARLAKGEKPVVRLYSTADRNEKIYCKDAVRGSMAFPQYEDDVVLIKSGDGLPTYHFAHLVDDYFIRTTAVVRGEEWLSSLPLHIQLFNIMGWEPPKYIHTSTLDTIDRETGKQRKLSKRKDPVANVDNFYIEGYPSEALLEYLFNIISPGYEENKQKGKVRNISDAALNIKKIPMSGALFDMKKLEWWAREFIASLSVEELANRLKTWMVLCGGSLNKSQYANTKYFADVLSIERDNPKRIRKDFITWKQTLESIAFFFAEDKAAGNSVTEEFLKVYDPNDDKDIWWNKIIGIAGQLNVKPGDVAMALRVALSGREQTPDLYSMMTVMGSDRVKKRLKG
ncbi:MAG: glutamate--tRNA ligase [Alphaproteobacteria bacterium]|nr:glutamate--tRNA ligase [Alphaproteobacteria bacterium]